MVGSELRLAELLASVSLATDLGTGQPLGHALRTCTIATALAEAMGCGADDVRTVHQFALLRFLGCTSDAAETAALVGGHDRAFNAAMAPVLMGSGREMMGRFVRSVGAGQRPVERVRLVARAVVDLRHGEQSLPTHCEVATLLAGRVGLGQSVVDALAHAYERWDGKGSPAGLEGDAIPLAVRVATVARDADLALGLGDDPHEWLAERSGRAYDPSVVDAFARLERTSSPDSTPRTSGRPLWPASRGRQSSSSRPRSTRFLLRSPTSPTSSHLGSAATPPGRGARRRGGPSRRARRALRATACGGPASSTTSAASPSRTGSGTSRVRSRPRSGSRCGSTSTTPSGSSSAVRRSRPSSSRRGRTTSASMAPATTVRCPPTRSRKPIGSWPRRMCSQRLRRRGRTALLAGRRRGPHARGRSPVDLDADAVACVLAAAGRRRGRHCNGGRPS